MRRRDDTLVHRVPYRVTVCSSKWTARRKCTVLPARRPPSVRDRSSLHTRGRGRVGNVRLRKSQREKNTGCGTTTTNHLVYRVGGHRRQCGRRRVTAKRWRRHTVVENAILGGRNSKIKRLKIRSVL